jgi:hypothetical protein
MGRALPGFRCSAVNQVALSATHPGSGNTRVSEVKKKPRQNVCGVSVQRTMTAMYALSKQRTVTLQVAP